MDTEFYYELADYIVRKAELYSTISIWEDSNGEWTHKLNYLDYKLTGYRFVFSYRIFDVIDFESILRDVKLRFEEYF